MGEIKKFVLFLCALSGVLWAQNVISVEAFDEQGGNPGQMTLRLRVVNGGADTVEGVRLRYFLKYEKSRKLVMGQTVKQIYGRFVANTLTIHQNSQVHRVDFDPIVPTLEVVWR